MGTCCVLFKIISLQRVEGKASQKVLRPLLVVSRRYRAAGIRRYGGGDCGCGCSGAGGGAIGKLMAKWGEGDPRWIVEERADATNVNNWHW